jgi:adenine-specific DNA methylase
MDLRRGHESKDSMSQQKKDYVRMPDRTRLIEVLMPLEQASILSPREKNVRSGGYISTFHVWPARRPLAACRAALLATLLPDPGDATKRAELLTAIGGEIKIERDESKDEDGNLVVEEKPIINGGVLAWNAMDSDFMESLRKTILEANGGMAPRVFDPFAGGGAIPYEAMWLGCHSLATDINPVAWLLLKGTLEYPQRYAGKNWPLPAFVKEWSDFMEDFHTGGKKRRAPKSHFTDNIQKTFKEMLEGDLRWHVRAWGRWVLDKARADLSKYYPVVNGEPSVAYLWARTVRDVQTEGRIPILKTFMICRKKGKRVALLPVPDIAKKAVKFSLLTEEHLSTTERRARVIEDHPFLTKWGIDAATLEDFLKKGTKSDAGVWSPFDKGRPDLLALNMDEIRDQGRRGLMGIQMTAVCVESIIQGKKKAVKTFRAPKQEEVNLALVQIEDIEAAFESVPYGIPDEDTPKGGGKRASRAFSLQNYGILKWRDVLTSRQLLAAGIFLKYTRQAIAQIRETDPENAEALAVYLTVVYGRFIDYCSQQCRWEPTDGEVKSTMSGYKLPLVWDFAESNPLSERDRYYAGGIRAVSDAVGAFMRVAAKAPDAPDVRCISSLALEITEQDLCFTDPPYYDAIPYADLMNFFRIWQKRIIADFNPEFREVFEKPFLTWDASKQDGELIDDDTRHGGDAELSRKTYEEGMTKAFSRSLAALKDDGRMVVVFANKEIDAWQSLIAALIRAGSVVTASWPIQTEMVNKVTQKRANLSTSVWIVCRKRDSNVQPGWEDSVLKHMRSILLDPREELSDRNILRYFFDLRVRGADFLWAALGPALAAYSAHPYVKKTGGGYLDVKEFLDEVRKLVLQFALGALKGFDDLQKQTYGTNIVIDPVTQYYLLHREAFGFEPVLSGVCILYANACGKTDRELQMVWKIIEQGGKKKGRRRAEEYVIENDDEAGEILNANAKADKFRLLRWDERIEDDSLGEKRGNLASPLIDKLHRLLYLLKQNRGSDVQAAYDEWGLAGDPAFPRLLQAVRELALEDHQIEEQRLVESLASQLKMNRRIVENNVVKETPLFDYVTGEKGGTI